MDSKIMTLVSLVLLAFIIFCIYAIVRMHGRAVDLSNSKEVRDYVEKENKKLARINNEINKAKKELEEIEELKNKSIEEIKEILASQDQEEMTQELEEKQDLLNDLKYLDEEDY